MAFAITHQFCIVLVCSVTISTIFNIKLTGAEETNNSELQDVNYLSFKRSNVYFDYS